MASRIWLPSLSVSVTPFGPGDDPRALGGQLIAVGKGMHVVRGIQRLQFGGGHMVGDHGHVQTLSQQ